MNTIYENIETVERKIRAACERSGRRRDEVTLIAVSKTKPIEDIIRASECGITAFGENRVQELVEKAAKIEISLNWHLIGHLQTNKAKYLPNLVSMVHSIDSEKLARETDRQAGLNGIILKALCEVNIAREESKYGFMPEEAAMVVNRIVESCPNLNIRGLMTVAPKTVGPESNRVYFRQMKQLLDEINESLPNDKRMTELSMGMSGDYEIAIEEGATFVRVGSAIFGERSYEIN